MKIEIEISDEDAKELILAKRNIDVSKFSNEGLEATAKETVKILVYETIANCTMQRVIGLKKLELEQWLKGKIQEEKE